MHDLTQARKNARTDEDAAAIAWAEEKLEELLIIQAQMTRTINRQSKRIAAQRRRIEQFHTEQRKLKALEALVLMVEPPEIGANQAKR